VAVTAISAGIAGIDAASRRIGVASHNIANLLTQDFRPLRATQLSSGAAGVEVAIEQAPQPEPVSLEQELVGMMTASLQARASMRVIDTDLDLVGSLIDAFV
jgi:flagellar hook protein FlgE